jgi:quercetin dioxygenase-like cupin family protein
MRTLGAFPEGRADRHASAVLHDEASVRVVAFTLRAGQQIGLHRSLSSVLVHVVRGRGRFIGEGSEAELGAGQSAVFAPGEEHAIDAGADGVDFLAMLAPGPTATLQATRRTAGDAAAS